MATVLTITLALSSWSAIGAPPPDDVRDPGCAGMRDADGGADHTVCRPSGAKPEQAICIHGHHCACAGGFVCADSMEEGECAGPGKSVFCIPMPEPEPEDETDSVTDAESSMSDIGCLDPAGADSTPCRPDAAHATQAFCVFGDHCACYTGYVCADTLEEGECSPGTGGAVFCVPRDEKVLGSHGDVPADNATIQRVSGCLGAALGGNLCLPLGALDEQAMCVFGDHCLCKGGLVCADTLTSGECGQGSVCIPEPGTTTTTTQESGAQRLPWIAALLAAAFSSPSSSKAIW